MNTFNPMEYTKESFRIIYSRFSHELRNPLALVVSELQLLASRHPEVSDYNEWETIQDNLQYMQELLNEFSDYNNAGKLQRHPTDLEGYLKDVSAAVRPSMEYLDILFTLQVEPDLPRISIDRIKLRQVLLNLLRNAQDALPETGGQIKIHAFLTKDHQVCISVADNGCGISSEQLPEIFQPFVTFKKNGSGLGLAIAKQIIEAHQGKLTVESESGKGTSFHILL